MKIIWGRSIGWNISYNNYRSILKYAGDNNFDITHKNIKMEYTIIENGADCYPWMEYFAILPRKTVTGKRIWWQKAYKRKVWVVWGIGFHMEPHVQYATAFDLLMYDNNYNTKR